MSVGGSPSVANSERLMLHLGGTESREGWTLVNINPTPMEGVKADVIATISDLSSFESGTVDVIYTSHTLEHVGWVK